MKFYLVLFLVTFFLRSTAFSQDFPPPNPSMSVSILSGYGIVFNFDAIDDYTDGIMNEGQSTYIRIGSVIDWKLQFAADQSIFYGENNPANQMELNNVGVIVISTGTNLDDGSQIINHAQSVPIALQSNEVTLLSKGTESNKGWGIENAFILNWEMGTRRGNMNNQSIFEQHIAPDTYTLTIVLTLTAN